MKLIILLYLYFPIYLAHEQAHERNEGVISPLFENSKHATDPAHLYVYLLLGYLNNIIYFNFNANLNNVLCLKQVYVYVYSTRCTNYLIVFDRHVILFMYYVYFINQYIFFNCFLIVFFLY